MTALRASDFDMRKVTVICKGGLDEKHMTGCYHIDGHFGVFGLNDVFWERLWSSAPAGVCFHLSEGGGALFVAGPLVMMLHAMPQMAFAPGDFNPLCAVFNELGIGRDDVSHYLTVLQSGCLALFAQGSPEELEQAFEILKSGQPLDVSIYLTGN